MSSFVIIVEKSSYSSARDRRNLVSSTTTKNGTTKPSAVAVVPKSGESSNDKTGANTPNAATEVVPVISDSAEVNTKPSEERSKGEVVVQEPANNIPLKTMEK